MSVQIHSASKTITGRINRFAVCSIPKYLPSCKYLLSLHEGVNPYKTGRHIAHLMAKQKDILAGAEVVEGNVYLYIHSKRGMAADFAEVRSSLSSKVREINLLSEEQDTPVRILREMVYTYFKGSSLLNRMTLTISGKRVVVSTNFRIDISMNTVYLTLNPVVESNFSPIGDPLEWINERVYCQNLAENSYGVGILAEITNTKVAEDRHRSYRDVYVKYAKREWKGMQPPSLFELWTALGHKINPDDVVVKIQFPKGEPCSYPCSKIYEYKYMPLPKDIWKKIVEMFLSKLTSIKIGELKLEPSTQMEKVELVDLMDKPIELQFSDGVQKIYRNAQNPDLLSTTPRKEIKTLGALYGKRKIHLVVVHPKTMGGAQSGQLHPEVFCKELARVMSNVMGLAEDLSWELIPYTIPNFKETGINKTLWENQLSSEIRTKLDKAKTNPLLRNGYPLCLCFVPKRGQTTLKFKEWIQDYLTRELELLVQGVDTDGSAASYFNIITQRQTSPLETLSLLIYYNAVVNKLHKLRKGNDIDDAVLWAFTQPMGDNADERIVYIGYDASGEPTEPTRSPMGAFYTILDDYGKLIRTGCVEEERSHRGKLDEYALRRILQAVTQKQRDFPNRIVLLVDGWAEASHWTTLNKLYEEMRQTFGNNTPQLVVVESIKSSPYRLIKDQDQQTIENIPFGYMTFLSDKDVLMIAHPLLTGKDKLKRPVRYFVSGRFTPQGLRNLEHPEVESLMRALFHSCFLTFSSGSVPYRLCKPIHSTHKLSKLFYKIPSSRKEVFMKE